MTKAFLHAEWRKLVMANYTIDQSILTKYLPAKTEFDLWNDRCYVSLVGFMFLNTSVKGIKFPFHINFEEVNLRFYVRYKDGDDWKRGVVFIKEIVPKRLLTFVANTVYNENYETLPMQHRWVTEADQLTVEYRWKKKQWNTFRVISKNSPETIYPGSEEEFITEHYWGYTKISNDRTAEYAVEHPKWHVYPAIGYDLDVDFGAVYGVEFEFLRAVKPVSVFLAEGSEILVREGRII